MKLAKFGRGCVFVLLQPHGNELISVYIVNASEFL